MSGNQPNTQTTLAERLRAARVGVRQDLDVSRHVFRGEPCYIIRDPITFQSHRLEPEDYQVLVSIEPDRTLGETFTALVEQGFLDADGEESFYHFVFTLHRLGFLNLPVSDGSLLYKRYRARRHARRKQKLLGFLFLQIPLINPDAFLDRTLPAVRWIYSRAFFVVWLLLIGAAGVVAATRWTEITQPVHGLLATRNLVLMWFTLIALKVCHEFGHAFACKHYGGHVPEMGIYLIAFTPCAYVDATAAWGFQQKWHRLHVSLAGVYVESVIAAVAVFVWAATGPSLLNAIAYNVMFLASVVTLLFNINPLMRYDGYYVAGDLLEVPNLRQRSTQYVLGFVKRLFLGVPRSEVPASRRLGLTLLMFGLSATAYRTLVLLAIATVLALKFSLVGLALAGFFLGAMVIGIVRRLVTYLWYAQETAPVRFRAVTISALLLIVLPTLAAIVPLPARVRAAGSVVAADEVVVHAAGPGFVRWVAVERGQDVHPGDLLLELDNMALAEEIARAQSALEASEIRRRAFQATSPAQAQQEAEHIRFHEAALTHALEERDRLRITTPFAGRVADGLRNSDSGRYVKAGEAVVALISGDWQVRTVLTAEQFAAADPTLGDRAEFRTAGNADATLVGMISRISPAGSRRMDLVQLTHLAGGDVVVKPGTAEATQPYFHLTITLLDEPELELRPGLRGMVLLPADSEPAALRIYRSVKRFINKLSRA
ncbi:MAG: biotin/lipoyl-binding protein [Planctomycetes bacterium]|nr:biotin/lipoyl-binding protein [Planctomycetota bacterium]